MTIPFTTFLPDVALEVQDCPALVIRHHTIKVLTDFCKQSRYLRETLAPISVVAGTAAYAVAPSDNTQQLVRVEEVWFNGVQLDPITTSELDAEVENWRTDTGTPVLYTWTDEKLQLVPVPDTTAAGALEVRISYAIDPTATLVGFDPILYKRFDNGLAAGIKASLMMIPNKAWSNPDLAMAYQRDYKVAVALAKNQANKGLSRARRRTATYYR